MFWTLVLSIIVEMVLPTGMAHQQPLVHIFYFTFFALFTLNIIYLLKFEKRKYMIVLWQDLSGVIAIKLIYRYPALTTGTMWGNYYCNKYSQIIRTIAALKKLVEQNLFFCHFWRDNLLLGIQAPSSASSVVRVWWPRSVTTITSSKTLWLNLKRGSIWWPIKLGTRTTAKATGC